MNDGCIQDLEAEELHYGLDCGREWLMFGRIQWAVMKCRCLIEEFKTVGGHSMEHQAGAFKGQTGVSITELHTIPDWWCQSRLHSLNCRGHTI